jgi:plastocyanin
MTKNVRLIIVVAGILVVTSGFGFGLARLTAPKTASAAADHTVNLLADRADPTAIAVLKGEYVQFNSKDGKTHNIGQGSGDDPVHQQLGQDVHAHNYNEKESGNFGADEGYRVQFNEVGTYAFHDHLNPKISVTVIVYEKKK